MTSPLTNSYIQRLALLAFIVTQASVAAAIDRVRLVGGGSETGDLVKMTKNAVTLEQAAGSREITAIQIDSILFDGEPSQLTQARINLANGGYTTAIEKLDELRLGKAERKLLQDEVAFYKAYARAKAALAGDGDIAKAFAGLKAFASSSGESVHYYTAVETLGDLLVAAERYDQANKLYAVLSRAPFDLLKARALVRSGHALQASGDSAAAIQQFDKVISNGSDDEGLAAELTNARLGRAECLAATDRLSEAVALLAEVLSGSAEDDESQQAAIYNTLGRCYEASGQPKDALFAYLHTDLLFDRDPDQHAEALARLAELWRDVGKPEAARDAQARLRRDYAETRWARGAG